MSYWRIALWGGALFLFLLPRVAMQLTSEMAWDRKDFLIFGGMLVAACSWFELAVRLTANPLYRAAIFVAVAAAFILLWLELAVGLGGFSRFSGS